MTEITRFLIEAGCVSVFVVTLAVAGVRVQPRLLIALRYAEARAARFPALELPKPRLRAFILRPFLAILAIGVPALTLFVLVRGATGWPALLPTGLLVAIGPVATGVIVVLQSRSEWADVREVLTRALAMPADRRDEVLPDAFDADPQMRAVLGAKDEASF